MRLTLSVLATTALAATASAQFSPFDLRYTTVGLVANPIPTQVTPTAATVPSGLTAGSVTRGLASGAPPANALTPQGTADQFASSNWPNGGTIVVTSSPYLTFTLTPLNGGTLNLDTLTFNLQRSGANASAEIRTSLDGFATAVGVGNVQTSVTPLTTPSSTLTGPLYDAIVTPVEIRLYAAFSGGNQANQTLNLLDGTTNALQVTGTFNPVPEPATVGLLATAGLGLAGAARRRFR